MTPWTRRPKPNGEIEGRNRAAARPHLTARDSDEPEAPARPLSGWVLSDGPK